MEMGGFMIRRPSVNPAAKYPLRESDLVQSILEYLWARKIKAWRCNTGGMKIAGVAGKKDRYVKFNEKGTPDILGFLPPSGRGLAIECKRKGNKATEAQQRFIDEASRCGALAFVTDDMDEAMRVIEAALRLET